jgi:hypothetical protein
MATAKFNEQMKRLKEFFGDKLVVDAKADLHIQPTEEDIRTAVPGDPQNCAFSRACQRMYGSKGALFLGHSAYVDLLDEHGRSVVKRHILSRSAQEFVDNFDAKAEVWPAGFSIRAPTRSATSKARRSQRRKYWKRKTQQRRAAAKTQQPNKTQRRRAAAATGRAALKKKSRPTPRNSRFAFFAGRGGQ